MPGNATVVNLVGCQGSKQIADIISARKISGSWIHAFIHKCQSIKRTGKSIGEVPHHLVGCIVIVQLIDLGFNCINPILQFSPGHTAGSCADQSQPQIPGCQIGTLTRPGCAEIVDIGWCAVSNTTSYIRAIRQFVIEIGLDVIGIGCDVEQGVQLCCKVSIACGKSHLA